MEDARRMTRVCRHWRDLAMQCPAFWSCPPLALVSGPVECLEKILARSKDYPLSILMHFRSSNWSGQEPSVGIERIYGHEQSRPNQRIQLLGAQAYRLRRLHVKASSSFLGRFQSLLAEETPRLVSLRNCPYDIHSDS